MATFSMAGVLQFSPKLADGAFSWATSVANQLALSHGTGAGQANGYWEGSVTLAAEADTTVDLLSLAFAGLGASGTVGFSAVKMLAVVNQSPNVIVSLESGATNGWDQIAAGELHPSGSLLLFAPSGGMPVSSASRTIKLTNQGTVSTLSATTTSASASVTLASTAGLAAGMLVSGTGVPSGAKILAVVNSTTITLSANATANGTGVSLAFQWPAAVVNLYAAGILD